MTSDSFKKAITLFFIGGALVVLLFGYDLLSNRRASVPTYDFSELERPNVYKESPREWNQDAKVVMYEFGDYNCKYCRAMQPVIAKIGASFKDKIEHVWKDFPFLSDTSVDAAAAARCAGKEGKFWEYHAALFAGDINKRTAADLAALAEALGLKIEPFTVCLESDTIEALVARDFAEGQALGVSETPTYVIGDTALVGEVPYEDLERAIKKELGE